MSEDKRIYITGSTYPVKEQLKALGCRYDPARKAWYHEDKEAAAKAQELVEPTGLLNSPPPADLGTADPVALAAQFGRTAVAGTVVRSYSVYGLGKGDDGLPNGTIHRHRVKGQGVVLVLQVARTRRKYLSRDWLEDCDLFGAEPGGSYQWDGVEVELTPQEATAIAEEAARRAAVEHARKRRQEITNTVRKADNCRQDSTIPAGMVKVWGETRMAGSEGMYVDVAAGLLIYYESSYDDGPYAWGLVSAEMATEALTLAVK